MTYYEQMFDILGLKPTKDQRRIKKAYAQRVKKYHPEEDAEKWQEIHHAYQKALEYAAQPETQDWNEWRNTSEELEEASETKEFEKIFEEIESGESDEDLVRKIAAVVLGELENLRQISGYSTPAKWKKLLRSADFNLVCEEEEVLRQLKLTVLELPPDQPATAQIKGLVSARMEQLMLDLQASGNLKMQLYVKQVIANCRHAHQNSTPPPGKESAAPKQKKKSPARLLKILAVIVIIVAAAFKGLGSLDQPLVSEDEAAAEIITYLTEKYPEFKVDEDDLSVSSVTIYPRNQSDDLECGYRTRLSEMEVYLFYWEDDGETRMRCFDNYQKQTITADIGRELLETAGLTEGQAHLNWFEDGFYDLFGSSNAQFHSRYDGDMMAFLEQEAEYKQPLRQQFFEMLKSPYETQSNENPLQGRCLIYFKDDSVASVGQRITEPPSQTVAVRVEALEEAAAKYQMQIECIGLPQELYQRMETASREDDSLESTLERVLQRSEDRGDMPFMPHLMTSWYITGREMFAGTMQMPLVKEVSDGVYVMGVTTLLQQDLDIIEVETVTPPEEFKEIVGDREMISYQCNVAEQPSESEDIDYEMQSELQSQESVLILDKEKLGISDDNYQVGTTYKDPDDEVEVDDNTIIHEPARKMADQLYEYTDVVDEAGYIAIKVDVSKSYQDIIVTIAK